jgi:hypothetical protein
VRRNAYEILDGITEKKVALGMPRSRWSREGTTKIYPNGDVFVPNLTATI